MNIKTIWQKFKVRIINLSGGDAYLCDSCLYSYRNCSYHHREYPNATRCPDYKMRY